MAGRTITQRIQLVGGDEIKVQLDGIGKTGELAFTRLAAAANTTSIFSRFGGALQTVKARMETVTAAGEKVARNFESLGSSIGAVGERLGIVVGIGLVEAGRKLIEIAKQAGAQQETLDNTAAAIGTSAEKLDAFQKVAELSGISSESFTKALLKLNAAANTATKSDIELTNKKKDLFTELQLGRITQVEYTNQLDAMNKTAAESTAVFNRLGVSFKNDDGTQKDSLQLFQDVGKALSGISDGAKRSGLAMELFGTRNAKVTNLSLLSREEFEKQRAEVERLTPALQKTEREGLATFGDRLELLGSVATTTRDKIFATFAPELTRIVNAIIEKVAGLRQGMVAIAEDLDAKLRPIADDIVAVIEGRDADVKNSSILKFRDAAVQGFEDIKGAANGALVVFAKLKEALDLLATGINEVFGTKLTGGELLAGAALLKLTGLLGVISAAGSTVVSIVKLLAFAFGGWEVAIAAAGFALGFFIVQSIQKLGGLQAIATRVLQGITIIIGRVLSGIPILIGQGVQLVINAVQSIGALIGALISSIAGFFAPAVTATINFAAQIITAIANVPSQIAGFFSDLGGKIAGVWSGIVQTAKGLWDIVTQLFITGIAAVVGFFQQLSASIGIVFASIVQLFTDTWNSGTQLAQQAADAIAAAFQGAVDTITGFFRGLYDSVVSIFDAIIAKAQSVISAVSDAIGAGGGGGGGPQSNAQGGHVRGPGTGTSDSILSWLSNGEYVIRAAAVKKFGVGFFAALNNLRSPGFASGGLVSAASAILPPIPRFAAGGLVAASVAGGGRPFALHIGGEEFAGMTASQDTVDRLQRYAVRKQVHSAGRKPTWFQG